MSYGYSASSEDAFASERRDAAARSNPLMLALVTVALCTVMSVGQEDLVQPGSLQYWLLVLSPALLPLLQWPAVLRALAGPVWWMVVLLFISGAWHFSQGSGRVVLQLGLLTWMTAWVASERAHLRTADLVALYWCALFVGLAVWGLTNLNQWGPFPGLTADEYGIWRVSFFPNIAYTAFFSLAVLLAITKDRGGLYEYKFTVMVALYFLVMSFVRTAIIGFLIFLLARWWFDRRPSPSRLFWGALALAIGVNVAIPLLIGLFGLLQGIPVISRLFFRGESGLDSIEIYQQLYRPWLWLQHWELMLMSPGLMGWGIYDFNDLKTDDLMDIQTTGDTVSLLTRLMVAYGLPGALFTFLLIARLRAHARAQDTWACACFPTVILLLMQWGATFHPGDAMFTLFMLILLRGRVGWDQGRSIWGRQ